MPRPLRVLALHSFRTSAAILRRQLSLAGLDSALADLVEFVYVNAPHQASGLIPSDVASIFEGPYYEYWNAEKAMSKACVYTHAQHVPPIISDAGDVDEQGVWHYHGAKESLQFYEEYVGQHGPFDGVMGFSQGGAIAALLMGMQQHVAFSKDTPALRFCLVFAGIRARDPELAMLLEEPLVCPALHIIGDKDYVLKAAYDLKSCFKHAELLTHSKGHVIPRLEGEALQQLRSFLQRQQRPASAL